MKILAKEEYSIEWWVVVIIAKNVEIYKWWKISSFFSLSK